MNQADLIERILEIESDTRILEFKMRRSNIAIWPFIRVHVMFHIYYSLCNMSDMIDEAQRNHGLWKLFKTFRLLIQSLRKRPLKGSTKDRIVFIASDVYNSFDSQRKAVNRLYDPLASIFAKDTLILENAYDFEHKSPRAFENVRYIDSFNMLAYGRGLLQSKLQEPCEEIKQFTDYLFQRIESVFPERSDEFAPFVSSLRSRLFLYDNEMFFLSRSLGRFLHSSKPRMLIVDSASYGFRHLVYVRVAKALGIPTAEVQHGFISKGHFSYNFHNNIVNAPVLREYLPDSILMHGEYWRSRANTPARTFVMGNPSLRDVVVKEKKRFDFLFISQSHVYENLIELVMELHSRIGHQKSICYRLHPSESKLMTFFRERFKETTISIDSDTPIQELLCESENIVGVDSTVLWEALRVTQRIFVYNCIEGQEFYVSNDFGVWFKNVDDLLLKTDNAYAWNNLEIEQVWRSDWIQNYREFILTTANP